MSSIIKVSNLSISFKTETQTVAVLKDISFTVSEGDFVIIFGPSGCGKSTLLHSILGLEIPTQGTVLFDDQDIYKNKNEDDRAEFRKNKIGMVYQQPNWIKSLNVLENIAFPLTLQGVDREEELEKAKAMLEMVKLSDWAGYLPAELSSGQQQRIALARALISNPKVLVADEPTGNLDYDAGQNLMLLLEQMNKKEGKTIVMVTHDLEYLKFAKSAIKLFDGKVIEIIDHRDFTKIDKLHHKKIS